MSRRFDPVQATLYGTIIALCILWCIVFVGAMLQSADKSHDKKDRGKGHVPVLIPIQTGNGTQVFIPA